MNIFIRFANQKISVMMIRYLFYIGALVFLSACSSKKNIIYVQDILERNQINIDYKEYKINVDDILKIDVKTENPETVLIFNTSGLNASYSGTKEGLIYNGYQVNKEGIINFPRIGKIKVLGKSATEIRDFIYKTLVEKKILNDPSVDVKILNTYFTILGEVKSPGRYEFFKNNMNLFEAIGMAGDLTINGLRDRVKIIRNGSVEVLDLTKSDFFENEYFQIISGDIIIVDPNTTRVKDAGIIGNSGTLISLLSFLLSSIIVINR